MPAIGRIDVHYDALPAEASGCVKTKPRLASSVLGCIQYYTSAQATAGNPATWAFYCWPERDEQLFGVSTLLCSERQRRISSPLLHVFAIAYVAHLIMSCLLSNKLMRRYSQMHTVESVSRWLLMTSFARMTCDMYMQNGRALHPF